MKNSFPKFPKVLREHAPEVSLVFLGVAGLLFWLVNTVNGTINEMMSGLGVEVIGAIITALGVLGLERIYAKPDPQIENLSEQITKQNEKIDSLQTQLQIVLDKLTPAIKPSDVLSIKETPDSEDADTSTSS